MTVLSTYGRRRGEPERDRVLPVSAFRKLVVLVCRIVHRSPPCSVWPRHARIQDARDRYGTAFGWHAWLLGYGGFLEGANDLLSCRRYSFGGLGEQLGVAF